MKVTFTATGGLPGDVKRAQDSLVPGIEYLIQKMKVGGHRTEYFIDGEWYNSTMFSPDTSVVFENWTTNIDGIGEYIPASVPNDSIEVTDKSGATGVIDLAGVTAVEAAAVFKKIDAGLVRASPMNEQVAGDHYKSMKIQPAEFCQANQLNFCESSAIKYLCRHRRKNGVEDLNKAIHFIEMLKEMEYGS